MAPYAYYLGTNQAYQNMRTLDLVWKYMDIIYAFIVNGGAIVLFSTYTFFWIKDASIFFFNEDIPFNFL